MKLCRLVAVFGCLMGASIAQGQGPLFTYQGKTYALEDLPPAVQQNFYEADRLHYENYQQISEFALLELYYAAKMTATRKTREEVEKEALPTKAVSDGDVRSWYEANKSRLGGRPFDTLKGEIRHLLERQEQDKSKEVLLTKIKLEGRFVSGLVAPNAPKVQIKTDGFPAKGNLSAAVSVVVLADYKCPHCKKANESLAQVMEKYKSKVKYIFLDFPLMDSGVAKTIADAALCAEEQGKFWEYHDRAFAQQDKLDANSPEALAKELSLDVKKFGECLTSGRGAKRVAAGKEEGLRIGVQGTPAIFVSGRKQPNYSVEVLSEAIEAALKGQS